MGNLLRWMGLPRVEAARHVPSQRTRGRMIAGRSSSRARPRLALAKRTPVKREMMARMRVGSGLFVVVLAGGCGGEKTGPPTEAGRADVDAGEDMDAATFDADAGAGDVGLAATAQGVTLVAEGWRALRSFSPVRRRRRAAPPTVASTSRASLNVSWQGPRAMARSEAPARAPGSLAEGEKTLL